MNFRHFFRITLSSVLLLNAGGFITADGTLQELSSKIKGLSSSFSARFTYTTSGGSVSSGKMYFQSPNKLHVQMADGGVVATNGRFLWIYNPGSVVCAKQEVGGRSSGIFGLLSSYQGSQRGNTYVFRKPGAYYDEIIVTAADSMLKSVRLKHEDEITTYSFSSVQVGRGISPGLFNFRPPTSVRIIENPLNN